MHRDAQAKHHDWVKRREVKMEENEQAEIENQVAQAEAEPIAEKMLTQSEVNELVGRIKKETKLKTYEKAKRDIMAELQQQAPTEPQQVVSQQANQSMGGMPTYTAEQIKQMVAEQTAQQMQAIKQQQEQEMLQQHFNRVVGSFASKIEAAKSKYPDIEDKLASLDLRSIAPIIEYANDVDNTADVMMDLIDNPHKIGSLLANHSVNRDLARKTMSQISSSIKHNEAAKNTRLPGDPIQSIHSSATQTGKVGDGSSVSDLRKFFSKRG